MLPSITIGGISATRFFLLVRRLEPGVRQFPPPRYREIYNTLTSLFRADSVNRARVRTDIKVPAVLGDPQVFLLPKIANRAGAGQTQIRPFDLDYFFPGVADAPFSISLRFLTLT